MPSKNTPESRRRVMPTDAAGQLRRAAYPQEQSNQSLDKALKEREAERDRAFGKLDDVYNQEQDTRVETVMHVSASGATSSHLPLRFDLIPRSMLEIAAKRYTLGLMQHGERGYQKGFDDRDFIVNRINHIFEHLNMLLHPDYRRADGPQDEEGIEYASIEQNLGAILWGVGFLCEVANHRRGLQLLHELRSYGRVILEND